MVLFSPLEGSTLDELAVVGSESATIFGSLTSSCSSLTTPINFYLATSLHTLRAGFGFVLCLDEEGADSKQDAGSAQEHEQDKAKLHKLLLPSQTLEMFVEFVLQIDEYKPRDG
ncbi:hypothetical protein Salat_0436400 [Sesamum alatum]|uniref:Uncharacterized protein n=1 Tax=Sesamum alatum TaxID=300844 RepID=A0AAE1Z2E2_9LAMI|nr:hypothetical protein Salat_0436400 [Sesamum alatum]